MHRPVSPERTMTLRQTSGGGRRSDPRGDGTYLQEIYMKKLTSLTRKFMKDESGVTTIEYALIGALIAVALIASFTALKASIAGVLTDIKTALDNA